jgi:hypothetical protein
MARHHPRAPKLVVSLGKVCKDLLRFWKERSKLVDWGKQLKKIRLKVDLGEQLKLPEWICRDHGFDDSKLW